MKITHTPKKSSILLMVAGAKGAVGSTVGAAVAAMKKDPDAIFPCLTTCRRFSSFLSSSEMQMVGWDTNDKPLEAAMEENGVLPDSLRKEHMEGIEKIIIRKPPSSAPDFRNQVKKLKEDMADFRNAFPEAHPVLINLLPACDRIDRKNIDALFRANSKTAKSFPDLLYAIAAVESGIPVVNFTPNEIEAPAFLLATQKERVPITGRDGKTGQTYLKVVLASALKERQFHISGWYSLNLLGNADGKNLMDPEKAAGKLANKTAVLDEILGASEGKDSARPFHRVHIDYYPPRGDAKEAWDVIDFSGLFGLPMSIRVNLLGRDSILAAPLVLDLARWMVALKAAGFFGPVPQLGFYFKMPVGENPPLTFQEQVAALDRLEEDCMKRLILKGK
ncbi:MAG: inositol-3-phosphate synthase [Pseudomonadota bacterium]